MSSLNPYSSELVSISWGGLSMSAGLSEGTFAMFTRNNDNVSEHVGADGQLTLTTIPDKTGTFDLECAQQSPTNHLLSAVQAEFDINRTVRRANMVLADPSGGGPCICSKSLYQETC